jgi:hypothetical protein
MHDRHQASVSKEVARVVEVRWLMNKIGLNIHTAEVSASGGCERADSRVWLYTRVSRVCQTNVGHGRAGGKPGLEALRPHINTWDHRHKYLVNNIFP